MKKIIFIALSFLFALVSNAQKKKDWSKIEIDRAGDHIMVQLSSDHWKDAPDSIQSHIKGFSRGLNIYVMLNKPFRSDPRWSVAFGVGVGSSNIFFKRMAVDIKAPGTVLPFVNLDSSEYFKKYKLSTSYLEAPVEIRYTFNPEKQSKSIKLALGGKVGTMLNAHTKGKTLYDKDGGKLKSFITKENSKRFFNGTRLCATGRIGYGHFSLFSSYQVNAFLKDGAGPDIRPFQVGLTISGL